MSCHSEFDSMYDLLISLPSTIVHSLLVIGEVPNWRHAWSHLFLRLVISLFLTFAKFL